MNPPTEPQPPAPRMFRRAMTAEDVNRIHRNTAVERLGIECLELGDDFVRARMPVDARTVQPAGLLHGGASVVLAETLGSLAATLCQEPGFHAVGLEINANHLRGVRSGWVHGECRPVHTGRTTHVWQIEIRDDAGRLACTSRITLAIVAQRPKE